MAAGASCWLLWQGEGPAGAEGEEHLCTDQHVLGWAGPGTQQETLRVSHRAQADHSAAILQDTFTAADSEAAWGVSRDGDGKTAEAKKECESEQRKLHGDPD